MKVAYLVGLYPKVSHTFIRREIESLEAAGLEVLRYSVRRTDEPLADSRDREEQLRTTVLLDRGPLGLAASTLRAFLTRPQRWARALRRALGLARLSSRGYLVHLVYLAEASALVFDLRRREARHLHAHFATNPTSVALLCHDLGGPPFSFTVHSPDTEEIPAQVGLDCKVAAASFVAAISNRVRAQILPWIAREDRAKVHVVRTTAGTSSELPQVAPPQAPAFVCVARLSPEKGHLVLLEALELLRTSGVEAQVDLVGEGPLRADICAQIAELGLDQHVRLLGNLDGAGVRDAVLGARALVLPSFLEGLPVVLLEAFTFGRPVITTAVGSILELVEDGASGWVVPAGSASALAAAILEAASATPERLVEMARVGADRVAEQHAPRDQAATLVQLMGRVESAS